MPPSVRRRSLAAFATSLFALTVTGVAYAGNGGFLPSEAHSPNAHRIDDAFIFVAVFTGLVFLDVHGRSAEEPERHEARYRPAPYH